jgi:hypothetical protein
MLSKEEYSVLYWISRRGLTDLEKLDGMLDSQEKIKKIVNTLEKKGFIKIEIRDGKIYGFIETRLGDKEVNEKRYEGWFNKLGD